jgi:hypothetical protein
MLHSLPTEEGKYHKRGKYHKSETTFRGPLTSRKIREPSEINYEAYASYVVGETKPKPPP